MKLWESVASAKKRTPVRVIRSLSLTSFFTSCGPKIPVLFLKYIQGKWHTLAHNGTHFEKYFHTVLFATTCPATYCDIYIFI
jgi:hypothetical protein